MGHFRFRKSIKIAPGVKLNLNKKSTSLTFGEKGVHYTTNSNGKRTTSFGIPGTGLSYVDVRNSSKSKNNYNSNNNYKNFNTYEVSEMNGEKQLPAKQKNNILCRTWFQIFMLLTFSPLGIFCVWYYKEWKTPIKVIISIFFILYFTFMCATSGA